MDVYSESFARNIGLLTPEQQQTLRRSRVAIAGCGGGGGGYAAAMARAGVGAFTLADPDVFELVNTNRQYGATADTVGSPKAEVMADVVRSINPEAEVTAMAEAIDEDNVERFLAGADVVLDGIDFFAPDARRLVYRHARRLGIPVIVGGPIGWSAAWQVFLPDGPSLEDFCGFRPGMGPEEVLTRYVVATTPRGTHLKYLRPGSVDFSGKAAPSLGPVCFMVHGIVASEAVNLLTGVRPVKGVPWYSQFDVHTLKFAHGRLRGGNRHPLQRLKIRYVEHLLDRGRRERGAAADDAGPAA